MRRTPLSNGRGFAASPSQRKAIKDRPCIVTGSTEGIDPAHLCARARGGCDDPLCVVPLRRDIHNMFDRDGFDLLPYLLAHGLVAEIQHALGHYKGDLIGLLQRLTGVRWFPEERRAA